MFSFEEQEKILTPILQNPSNKNCADCCSVSPNWASLDFGVFICSNCSGAHRALGPTITRVKSTKLDRWQHEWVDNMRIGNIEINRYWEGQEVEAMIKKPKIGSTLQEYNRYVYDKYMRRKYVKAGNEGADDPLTKFKKEIVEKQETNEEKMYMERIQERMEKSSKSQPLEFKQAKQITDFNLLDEEVPTEKIPFPNTHHQNEMTFKSAENSPSNFEEPDDEFTEYVSGNENLSTEKNSEISFDELMKQPKLETHSSHQPQVVHPPHHQPHNYVYTGHPPNIHINYQSPYIPHGNMNYQNQIHNGYVGYAPHYQQPNFQNKKSEQPQSSAQQPQNSAQQQPPYQNFTLK